MRAYSTDLRGRVLAACEAGMGTAEAAETFAVSESWVRRVKQRFRDDGEAAPRTPAQWHPRTPQHRAAAPGAQWTMDNGAPGPRAWRCISRLSLHNVYFSKRFPHPRTPHPHAAAPRRSTAPPQPAPRRAPGPPAPPRGESESRRRGRGGPACGGLPCAYREKGRFRYAGAYARPICASYTSPTQAPDAGPYASPICAQYASVCPYPWCGAFYFPWKAEKRENEKVVDLRSPVMVCSL